MPEAAMLSPQQVADQLGLSVERVYRLIRAKALPVYRLSARCLRIAPADLETFLNARRVNTKH